MRRLITTPFNSRNFKSAELVVGEREAIQGNINTSIMLENLKKRYCNPHGIDEREISDSIKTYQSTLKNE